VKEFSIGRIVPRSGEFDTNAGDIGEWTVAIAKTGISNLV
jgi:hypothetical protein